MRSLKELLSEIEVDSVYGEKILPSLVTGIAYHSGKVKPGNLFVCIKGYRTDGHQYLNEAFQNGALAAVVEYFVDDVKIPQYRTPDSRFALALLSSSFYDHPSRKMRMIGVTATNGKTTTTYMLNHILERRGLKTGMIGTVVIKSDDEIVASDLTTPESLDLQGYLAHMNEKHVTTVCMEVSSSALELKRVGGISFDIAVFNNISREHIDLHGSFERYCQIKSSLITNLNEKSIAVLNGDSAELLALKNKTKARSFCYSVESDIGDIVCENLDLSTGKAVFDVRIKNKCLLQSGFPDCFQIQLKVSGYHSVYNAMAAITVSLLSQVPIPTIQEALSDFGGVERRFELIFDKEFKIFDDHFANAGNIDVTLETVRKMSYEKFILIYAVRGSRGVIVNRENAEAIAKWSKILSFDQVIATASRSHTTSKDKVTKEEIQVLQEVLQSHSIKLELFDEIEDACKRALDLVDPGDVILMAGCQGMDHGAPIMLEEIHHRRPEIDTQELFAPLQNRVCST